MGMSPRSPHVNVRMHRHTHDQLDQLAIELSAVFSRRMSLTDVLDFVVATADRAEVMVAITKARHNPA